MSRAKREALGRGGIRATTKMIEREMHNLAERPKLLQRAKDAVRSGPAMKASNMARAKESLTRFHMGNNPAARATETAAQDAAVLSRASRDAGKTLRRMGQGVTRGLLSPAALAEGVAGSASKYAMQEKFKKEAREQDKPTKGGMKRVKTKA